MNILIFRRWRGAKPAIALSAGLLMASVMQARAQDPVEPPAERPPALTQPGQSDEEKLLKPEAKAPGESREEVLTDLFTRLRQAPGPDSAELVAEAIEAIWSKSGSDTVDLLMDHVSQSIENEDLDLALDILDSVVEIAPDYAEGWNRRATVLFLKQDYRRSLDDLRHVLALEPRHFKAINGVGLIMQELGDKQAALKAFRRALKLYPQSEDMKRVEKELSREVEGQGI